MGRERGVALHPKGADFAGGYRLALLVKDFEFAPRNGATDGARLHRAGRIGNKNVKSLGRADAVQNFDREAFSKTCTERRGQGLTGGDSEADTGEIELAAAGGKIRKRGVVERPGKEKRW